MQFKDVLGQAELKKRLVRSVRDARISHAQLFFGPQGTGKLPLAIAYAQYICCENKGDDDSCGICPSCVKVSKLIHPDVHYVFPVINQKSGASNAISDHFIGQWRESIAQNPYISENQWYDYINAENKQGFISRHEGTQILKKLSLKSYEGEYKIMIMWLAEKMNPAAANSLLKMIEEPPEKTLFLLISENTDLIIPTILSRTQMIRMAPLAPNEVRKGLKDRVAAEEELIEDAIHRANGNFSSAMQIIEADTENQMHFEEFVFFMRRSYERDIISLQKWSDKMHSLGRERLKLFLSYSLRMIRENFILNLKQEEISYMTRKEQEFSQRFSAFIHEGNVYEMAEEFGLAIEHIEANAYAKLVLLDLSIKTILLLRQAAPAE